jgi:hypothetical protein
VTQLGRSPHFSTAHSIIGMILVVLSFFVQPVAVWLGEQTKFLSLMRHKQFFRSVHRRNGQMLVFFGIANIFLGLVALDFVNGNGDYTYALKISYGVVVGITLMAYMLYQPKTTTFQVRSQNDFLVAPLCFHPFTFCFCSEATPATWKRL